MFKGVSFFPSSLKIIYLFIYLREREREGERVSERTEGECEEEAGSPLNREPDANAGLYLRNLRPWPDLNSEANPLSHPGTPLII